MRISIIAFGTRGDVQPVLALGKALKARGHQVRMLASANFKTWIEGHGLDAGAASVDIQAIMMGDSGHDWIDHSNNQFEQMKVMKKLLDEFGFDMMRDAWQACTDAEAVISSFTSDVYAVSIAEKLGAKHISTPLQPVLVATRSGMSSAGAPLPNRVSALNYLFGKLLLEPAGWNLMGAANNRFRQSLLGLPAQTQKDNWRALRSRLVVQGFSPTVVPHAPDWPANIHTAGYWFLDEDTTWRPPQDLLDHLKSGDAPVYVGFGSMTGRDPQRLTRLVVDAVNKCGQRAVLQSGWAGIGAGLLAANIFLLDSAPHNWLFPRMSVVVHHGGAGTTAESLRAGIPTIIVPHMADQPFWGSRVTALGVSPRSIPRHELTSENLACAIRQASSDPLMRQRAAELGAKIRAEDGIGVAVGVMDQHLRKKE